MDLSGTIFSGGLISVETVECVHGDEDEDVGVFIMEPEDMRSFNTQYMLV